MRQLLLAFVLVWVATLLFPGLEERAEPRIEESRIWLGEQLEGPLTPVLTPYRKLKTQERLREASRLLVRDRNRGRNPPVASDFAPYLRRHEVEPLDGWGAPIVMHQERDSVAVISAGPDMTYDTEDDMVTKVRYQDPLWRRLERYRRR